jgi:hypothetical protein
MIFTTSISQRRPCISIPRNQSICQCSCNGFVHPIDHSTITRTQNSDRLLAYYYEITTDYAIATNPKLKAIMV